MQKALPSLIERRGNIVNVSSVTGLRAFPGVLAYCVSKAALDQLTRCASLELAAKGVRVNAVNPGVVVTEIHKRGGMNDEAYAAFLEHSKTTHPLGRTGRPEEIADRWFYILPQTRLVDHRRNVLHRRRPCPNLCALEAVFNRNAKCVKQDLLYLWIYLPLICTEVTTPDPYFQNLAGTNSGADHRHPNVAANQRHQACTGNSGDTHSPVFGTTGLAPDRHRDRTRRAPAWSCDCHDSRSALYRAGLMDRSLRSRTTLDAGDSFLLGRSHRYFLRLPAEHDQPGHCRCPNRRQAPVKRSPQSSPRRSLRKSARH